jgi:HAD superfamily hydrolase (TIGR01509 family)
MNRYHFDAVIFDLDGVITNTAAIHSAAWKQTFNEFLRDYARHKPIPCREFDHEKDYLPYVDGKPRYRGVESFLASRGISLPYGNPTDAPGFATVCGVGNHKNALFAQFIQEGKIQSYPGTVDLLHKLHAAGIRIGVASSSKNAQLVLQSVGLSDLIETLVDGLVSVKLGLSGKPEPDIFTTACDNLNTPYDRAVVVEDAISGVQAAQKGGFGLTLGVAREQNALALKANGADLVVTDLAETNIEKIENWFCEGLENAKTSLDYAEYRADREKTRETLLSIGNGYFVTRGAFEECAASQEHYPGTYLAALYNRLGSKIGEKKLSNEDLVNIPNWLPLTFKIDNGMWFKPAQKEISRRLDFRTGVLTRSLIFTDAQGRKTRVTSQRFASMDNPHLAALRYEVTPLNYTAKITFRAMLDGKISNTGVARYRKLNSIHLTPLSAEAAEAKSLLAVRTNQSKIVIAEASRLHLRVNGREIKPHFETQCTESRVTTFFTVDAKRGEHLTVDKLVAIYASHQEQVQNPCEAAQNALSAQLGFDSLQRTSAAAWKSIRKKTDIRINGDRNTQKLLRLHLYHSLISVSPHNKNLDAGLPARGLHGEAYRGHIFWDEVYIQPWLNLHFPQTARAALMYRYRRLNAARAQAAKLGLAGAIFPWQSGSSGDEETQKLHLNPLSGKWDEDHSTLQRHVNLALAYNIWHYQHTTNDNDFLADYGAEVFFEICRFWASKAVRDKKDGRYNITGVMGPDEFHEKYPNSRKNGLKNNSYTNILVAWTLQRAFELRKKIDTASLQKIDRKLRLSSAELNRWQDLTRKLNVSLSPAGIIEQFDGYFSLQELDWAHYRKQYGDIHRLDRILKAEGKSPDAYKIAKQADALMPFYLLSEKEIKKILEDLGYAPPEDLLQKNFTYYLKRTSHGSTLSRLVHAHLAWILGKKHLGWELYTAALSSDYADIQGGTTQEGIHLGVMTGTIFFALRTLAGIDTTGEILSLNPQLPAHWREISFRITFKGCTYVFRLGVNEIRVKIKGQEKQKIRLYGKTAQLYPEKWQKFNPTASPKG